MVYLSTRFLFSAFYLSTRASYLRAMCCPGDTTCSHCWMCHGSDLRYCWDQSVIEIEVCENKSDDDRIDKLKCACTSYSRLAKCWMPGTCCSEFSPTLAAAANLCNLATHPPDQITEDLFHKVMNDAYNTRQTIYHNDIGTDVPKLKMYVQASTQEFTESVSHYTRNVTAHTEQAKNYLVNLASNAGNQNAQSQDNSNHKSKVNTNYKNNDNTHYESKHETTYENKHKTNYKSKSETETWENKNSESKLQGTTPLEKPETQGQPSEVYRPTTNHKSKMDGWPSNNKIYHKAKCLRHKYKCQTTIASQYHKARRHKSSQTHVKRSQSTPSQPQSPLPIHSELWKRNSAKCGLDFQGVPYPTEIPPTVAKEFAKFG